MHPSTRPLVFPVSCTEAIDSEYKRQYRESGVVDASVDPLGKLTVALHPTDVDGREPVTITEDWVEWGASSPERAIPRSRTWRLLS